LDSFEATPEKNDQVANKKDILNSDQNGGMVKISKFQIKYSFEMRK
jgi:hypothetical protein